MKYFYLFIFSFLLIIICLLAKYYSDWKKNIEGFNDSNNSTTNFKLNSKFQYIKLEKNINNSSADNDSNVIDTESTTVFIDIRNNDGTLFTLSTKNNMTLNTTTDNITIDLGSCLYYVSQIDKIVIQCDKNIDNNATEGFKNKHNKKTNNKKNNKKTTITNTSSTNTITNPFDNLSLLDCQQQVLSIIDFKSNISLLGSNGSSSSSNSDEVSNDIYFDNKSSVSFIFYNALAYNSEKELLQQLQNKYSDTVFIVTSNFTFPQSFLQNTQLENALLDPSSITSNITSSSSDASTTTPDDIFQNPPDCASTPYGCCRDGFTISNDLTGTNCPPLPCTQSTFGCCRDGITPSFDIQGTNCPKRSYT